VTQSSNKGPGDSANGESKPDDDVENWLSASLEFLDVVSGLMLGIMLARPASSFAAHVWSWRSSALYHAFMFGAFSIFWTAVPLWLSGPRFHLTQAGIAWVALAGVAGAVAPPIAGRLADRGRAQSGTVVAMSIAVFAFLLSNFAHGGSWLGLGLIVLYAVLVAVSANLVFGQRAIYTLAPEQRSRVNALYFARRDRFRPQRLVLHPLWLACSLRARRWFSDTCSDLSRCRASSGQRRTGGAPAIQNSVAKLMHAGFGDGR
jgi:predicted MFS family arabinose efflux permease